MSELSKLLHPKHPHNRKVVAYIRAANEFELDDQFEEIENYAADNDLNVIETFCDVGAPTGGLSHAFEALETADGLIICNLNRLVTHQIDRLRDLRPILHRFCSKEGKHLISIEEGLDTSTSIGQTVALEVINNPGEIPA